MLVESRGSINSSSTPPIVVHAILAWTETSVSPVRKFRPFPFSVSTKLMFQLPMPRHFAYWRTASSTFRTNMPICTTPFIFALLITIQSPLTSTSINSVGNPDGASVSIFTIRAPWSSIESVTFHPSLANLANSRSMSGTKKPISLK